MASDLTRFAGTVHKLRHEHDAQDLNQKIALYEPTASQSDKFLIKMEIRRLAQPTSRIIDLRDVLKSSCEAVEREGVTHYVDSLALEDLDRELKNYKRQYCLGVFEYVLTRAKNRNQEKTETAEIPDPRFVSLTRIHQRKEERIYYSTEVHIFMQKPQSDEISTPDYVVKTTDLSISGLSIKMSGPALQLDDTFYVKFAGLETEFLLTEPLFVKYRLLRQRVKDGNVFAILTQVDDQQEKAKSTCAELLKKCIHNQKRRNRVPVENTQEAVVSKLHEQFVIGAYDGLPMLVSGNSECWEAGLMLANTRNQELLNFLGVQNSGGLINALVNSAPIGQSLLANQGGTVLRFVLRFRDKNKTMCFASFSVSDVRQNRDIADLIRKALSQGGVRLLKFITCPVDVRQGAHVPTSLPNQVGEAFANLNRAPHPALSHYLKAYSQLCCIEDMTSSVEALDAMETVLKGGESNGLNIRQYLLSVDQALAPPTICKVDDSDNRMEDRFELTLPMNVMGRKRDNKDSKHKARTTNISTRGLHVTIQESHPFKEGDDVFVDIRIAIGDFDETFTQQRYHIVKCEEQELWLAVAGDVANHQVRKTLRQQLYANLDKLKAKGSEDPIYGLSKALRNVFASFHPQIFALTHKQSVQELVSSVIVSEKLQRLRLDDSLSPAAELQLLCKHPAFRSALSKGIASMEGQRHDHHFHVLAVSRKSRTTEDITLIVKIPELQEEETVAFLYNSLKSFGTPVLLRVNLLHTASVLDKYYRDEMRYLLRYAKLKHQTCLDIQEQTSTVLEIIDLSSIFED